MIVYTVTFEMWVDDSEPVFDIYPINGEPEPARWLIEAENEGEARRTAERFIGLETNSNEGITSVVDIQPASPEEILHLGQIEKLAEWIGLRL